MKKTDAEIKEAVLWELAWDTRLADAPVSVDVDGGVVSLTGTVSSWGKRQAAEEAAHRAPGVLDVANDVDVRLLGCAQRTDTELAHAVRHALEWHALVPDRKVRSTVSDGNVMLEGQVTSYRESQDAEKAVRDLAGVVSVINRIEIVPPEVQPDELRRSIDDALVRRAERDAKGVQIEIKGKLITVQGTVHSLQEREAVIGAVRGTRGVGAVKSELRVLPFSA